MKFSKLRITRIQNCWRLLFSGGNFICLWMMRMKKMEMIIRALRKVLRRKGGWLSRIKGFRRRGRLLLVRLWLISSWCFLRCRSIYLLLRIVLAIYQILRFILKEISLNRGLVLILIWVSKFSLRNRNWLLSKGSLKSLVKWPLVKVEVKVIVAVIVVWIVR